MKRRFASALVFLIASSALAALPQQLGYQGRLLNANGAPVTGMTTLRFSVHSSVSGQSALWEESQRLGLSDGYYSTQLGQSSADAGAVLEAALASGTAFLEVAIETTPGTFDVLSPRQPVGSVAYALHTKNLSGGSVNATSVRVNGVDVIAIAPQGCASGQVLRWSGTAWSCTDGVASVTVAGPLTITTNTNTPQLSIAVGRDAGTVAAGDDDRFMPSGAVMAFNRATCPPGWTAYAAGQGRTIIGANNSFTLASTGGAASKTLAITEMPAHNHGMGGAANGSPFKAWDQTSPALVDTSGTYPPTDQFTYPVPWRTSSTGPFPQWTQGGGQSFSLLPPYVALLMCEKN